MKLRAAACALVLALAAPAAAQQFFWIQFLPPVATSGSLPTCTGVYEQRSIFVQSPAPGSWYTCPAGGGSWLCVAGIDCIPSTPDKTVWLDDDGVCPYPDAARCFSDATDAVDYVDTQQAITLEDWTIMVAPGDYTEALIERPGSLAVRRTHWVGVVDAASGTSTITNRGQASIYLTATSGSGWRQAAGSLSNLNVFLTGTPVSEVCGLDVLGPVMLRNVSFFQDADASSIRVQPLCISSVLTATNLTVHHTGVGLQAAAWSMKVTGSGAFSLQNGWLNGHGESPAGAIDYASSSTSSLRYTTFGAAAANTYATDINVTGGGSVVVYGLPNLTTVGAVTYRDATFSGSTRVIGTTSGTLTSGNCVEFDAGGNLVDSGGTCGGGGGGSNHDLLSATHPDTTTASPTRGALVVGQTATPVWQSLAIGGAATFLRSDGTDAAWAAIADGDIPAAIARDSELHNQSHAIDGGDHTASGLTATHVLRATGATTFAFGALQSGDLPPDGYSGTYEPAGTYSGIGACAANNAATTLNDSAGPTCSEFTALGQTIEIGEVGFDPILETELASLGDLNTQITASIADGPHIAALTQEEVEDYAGALIANATGTHTGIAVTYQDITDDVDLVVDHDAATNFLSAEHVDWAGASAGTIDATNLPADGYAATYLNDDGDTGTGAFDFSAAQLEAPNATTCPATDCDAANEAGRICVATAATSGQQFYACEGLAGWVLQGDGGGGAATAIDADADATNEVSVVTSEIRLDPNDDATAEAWFDANGSLRINTLVAGQYNLELQRAGTWNFRVAADSGTLFANGGIETTNIRTTSFGSYMGILSGSRFVFNSGSIDAFNDLVVKAPLVTEGAGSTCADSGDGSPGTLALAPTTSVARITNSDADGCDLSLSEAGAVDGQILRLAVVSTAGGTVDIADVSGVTETYGTVALALWEAVEFVYATDRWVQSAPVGSFAGAGSCAANNAVTTLTAGASPTCSEFTALGQSISGGLGGEIDDNTLTTDDLGTDSVGASELASTAIEAGDIEAGDLPADGYAATYLNDDGDTGTGAFDFSSAQLEIPNATTCPAADCDAANEAGRICMATSATSGQQIFGCEGLGGWVLQGDGTGGGSSHDLMSATHTDTTAAAVSRGALIVGQTATPVWQSLAIGGAATFLRSDGTDATWSAIADGDLPQEGVEDLAGAMVANATGTHTGISITYQDATGDMDFIVDHDTATNFLAAEHVDWAAVSAGTIHATNYVDNAVTNLDAHDHDGGDGAQIGDAGIADGAVDGGLGGEIADASITADDLGPDSVGASELASTAIQAGDIEAGDLPADGYAATYLNDDGDTATGAHDYGAAFLEVPNGTAPVVSGADGRVAIDTTDGQLIVRSTTDKVFSPERQVCVTIENLAAADDNFEFWMAAQAVTVDSVMCRCRGTCSGLALFTLEDRGGTAMTITGTNPTCATTGNSAAAAVTAGNALVAGEGIAFDVTSVSPETDVYTLCITYTVDRQ